MGAAMAIKTQTRIMAAPIVALLDRVRSEITFGSQAIGDDVGDISGNNELDLSLMDMVPFLSPITHIECVDS